jgi:hypothetical protein
MNKIMDVISYMDLNTLASYSFTCKANMHGSQPQINRLLRTLYFDPPCIRLSPHTISRLHQDHGVRFRPRHLEWAVEAGHGDMVDAFHHNCV